MADCVKQNFFKGRYQIRIFMDIKKQYSFQVLSLPISTGVAKDLTPDGTGYFSTAEDAEKAARAFVDSLK